MCAICTRCTTKKGDLTICNPGSCSLPKDGKAPSVVVYDNGKLDICFLD